VVTDKHDEAASNKAKNGCRLTGSTWLMLLARLRRQMESDDTRSELAALRREVAELRLAVRDRHEFITVAAHELRSPMTPILGMTELALKVARRVDGACPPQIITLLEGLQSATRDCIKRATHLLEFSRIETGNLQLETSPVGLSALVLSIARRYEAAATRTGSMLNLELEDNIICVCDRLAVEQIVENLLSNALKFGMGNPVTVQLRSVGRLAFLNVQDRGIGVPPDQQEHIFCRFGQVVTQHRGTGFGIGLWIASRLVRAMNGQIAVSSNLGEGSTFTVTLPLSSLEQDQASS
jgi:two-component system, OmpR family, sensor kinase